MKKNNIGFYIFHGYGPFGFFHLFCWWLVLLGFTVLANTEIETDRFSVGLLALYDFQLTRGSLVIDQSGVKPILNLRIENPSNVQRAKGLLKLKQKTIIQSKLPATKVIEAIRQSGELTVEVWLQSAQLEQSGPARIVTLSQNSSNRNLTLGQDGNQFDVRFRTTETSNNGQPSLSSGSKKFNLGLTHLVYIRQNSGWTRIFINGQPISKKKVSGETINWNSSYLLALGNEISKGRPWLGTYHLVAIYGHALSPSQITQNFRAGIKVQKVMDSIADLRLSQKERFFDEEIVPILSRHCLECHDTITNNGQLDLSKKSTAYLLSYDQPVIIPNQSANSLLWQVVETDQMPLDRQPMSSAEKTKLRRWIDQGATWTTEEIDPLAHTFDRRNTVNWVRRLTIPEYVETVRTLTGVDITELAQNTLPPDVRADGFSNTAYNLLVDLKHITSYAELAHVIVKKMDVMSFAQNYSKKIDLTDKVMTSFINKVGRNFLRSDLNEIELSAFRGISTTINNVDGTVEEAVALVIEAMLMSPRFIYRIEAQRGDGQFWTVNEYELATRMSYAILGTAPDQELLDLAQSGKLFLPEIMNQQIDRMLQSSQAIKHSINFANDWLNLDRLANMRPDVKRFPKWNSDLASDMRAETLAFFEEVVWHQNQPLANLLNAQVTFTPPRLAQHYGLPVTSSSEALIKYDLQSVPERGGLLTQGSMLMIGGDEASMVTRGLFVLTDLLRSGVKDPPPCVDTTPILTQPGLTQRQIAEARVASRACGGCHGKFEPLAYGLEIYDGIGAFHQTDEHNNQLRQDGDIRFPGQLKPESYQTSAQLMDLLAKSDRISQSLTWKIAQFALGRPLGQPDALILEQINQQAQKAGGNYASVMRAIVQSDLVQKIRTEMQNEN